MILKRVSVYRRTDQIQPHGKHQSARRQVNPKKRNRRGVPINLMTARKTEGNSPRHHKVRTDKPEPKTQDQEKVPKKSKQLPHSNARNPTGNKKIRSSAQACMPNGNCQHSGRAQCANNRRVPNRLTTQPPPTDVQTRAQTKRKRYYIRTPSMYEQSRDDERRHQKHLLKTQRETQKREHRTAHSQENAKENQCKTMQRLGN